MRTLLQLWRRRRAIGVAAFALALGCSGDTTAPADRSFVGTYALQNIGGVGLPYLASQTSTTLIWINASQMTIGDDGTWTEKVTFQTDQGPQSYTQIGYNNGTWTLTGGQLTIFSTKNNKTEYTGGFAKNELDLVFGSTLITFVR